MSDRRDNLWWLGGGGGEPPRYDSEQSAPEDLSHLADEPPRSYGAYEHEPIPDEPPQDSRSESSWSEVVARSAGTPEQGRRYRRRQSEAIEAQSGAPRRPGPLAQTQAEEGLPEWATRVGFISLIAVLMIGALMWNASQNGGNGGFLGIGLFGSSSHIGYASAAQISFTTKSGTASSPSTLTAAVNGGDIPLAQQPQVSVSDSEAPAKESSTLLTPGQAVTFELRVYNQGTGTATSVGPIYSDSSKAYGCALVGSLTLEPGQNGPQDCTTDPKYYPALTWDDTFTNPSIEYKATPGALGADPYYSVPSDCSTLNKTDADTKAVEALQVKLKAQLPSGTNQVWQSIALSDLVQCSPQAGARIANGSSTYSVSEAGTANQTTYIPADAQAYQARIISPDSGYALIGSPSVCQGLSISNASATSATILCKATQDEVFNWPQSLKDMLVNSVKGLSQAAAINYLKKQTGLEPSTVRVQLIGGDHLPQNVENISVTVN